MLRPITYVPIPGKIAEKKNPKTSSRESYLLSHISMG